MNKKTTAFRALGWVAAAGLLAMALVGPSTALASEGNPPSVECAGYDFYFKIDNVPAEGIAAGTYADGDANVVTNWDGQEITISNVGAGGQTFDWESLLAVGKVVWKEGSSEFSNVYDPPVTEGSVADNLQQGLSHVTFCGDAQSETSSESSSESSSETTSETFTSSEEGETELPSEPNTATIGGNTTSGPSNSSWLLVAALGVLLASVLVMAPARSKTRR